MKLQKIIFTIATIMALSFMTQACSSYDPVPKSKCGKVVKHAKKILGDLAPKTAQMMADCKAASDSDRGCVMAATTKGSVSQCL